MAKKAEPATELGPQHAAPPETWPTTPAPEVTPQVTITEQAPVEEERKPSERTLAEMEAGRAALAARAKNP